MLYKLASLIRGYKKKGKIMIESNIQIGDKVDFINDYRFQIGDKVDFINDCGVLFKNRTIVKIDTQREERYFISPTDSELASVSAKNLQLRYRGFVS